MEVRDRATAPNLLWTVYEPDRELSHFVVLPKSDHGLAADALSFSHFNGSVRVTKNLRLLEIARVLVCLDHVAGGIVNANHGIVRAAAKHRVADCVTDRIRLSVPQATEWQRVGNQIDAAMIFTRSEFV